MTNEEIKAIEEIKGTAGFRVMLSLVEAKLNKVKDVTEIKMDGLVAEQALARKLCHEVLKEFFGQMGLTSLPEKKERETYE